MGTTRLPIRMFLWALSAIYMCAFASLYIQIPGLYGNDGILPARWMLRFSGEEMWERWRTLPTLLWLAPRLGLDTQQGMELLCLTGALLSMAATALPVLRDCRVFLMLWVMYLSLYQVGQVFLYFQWDNLLLEVGFLAVLIAPMNMPWARGYHPHDKVTFWLLRWLLFRLMFASGVVKLTSRCPTWWGLTALTYHYETQCLPTPLAWWAHQLPVWFQKLSVVGTFVIEVAAPFLFLSPIRRHRLTAAYMQVLLQVLIILSGNYNFFNLLTITLCLSLLDDQHVLHLLRKPETPRERVLASSALGWLCVVVEVCVYILLAYGTVNYFDLKVDWNAKAVTSKTAFTYHKFLGFLRAVARLGVWGGALSLLWEIVTAMFRCVCVRGVFRMFWRTLQWWVFAAASVTMFSISLVPYTYVVYQGKSNLWPGVHRVFELTDRYQLVNSYGLFRRMTGVGGRPEVVIEGSMDRQTWTEIEFTYKPGNVSAAPPVVAPHQPRLDWQMWFAALGTHSQSPWFSRLMLRLLQGKRDVIKLIQVDEDQYPFRDQAPAYLRAHRYKYWFTDINDERRDQQKWWRRVYVEEFYPIVHLGDSFLENMLSQHGLKDKAVVRRGPEAMLPWLLRVVGERVRAFSAPLVLCWMFSAAVSVCVLNTLISHTHTPVEGEGEEGKVNKRARKEERHREVNESIREEERDGPEEGRGRLEEERDGLEEERGRLEEEREGTEEEGEGTEEEGEGTEEERDGMENKEEEEPHSNWLRKRK